MRERSVPVSRPLRVYAFDPSLGRRHGNHMTVTVPYEAVRPGPRGRLLEVVDYDASNGVYYEAVDLDAPDVLVQDGLAPSEGEPRFHQQMAYAVAMDTIENFRIALGRDIHWTKRRRGRRGARGAPLRVFPHAFQDANAYYDPGRHALLFGYFSASGSDPGPGGQTVFTCLSHDIIAHETTHALLHDVRRYFMEPTGPDTLAFHEALSDIVALLQHFSFSDALVDHVRRTSGSLSSEYLPPSLRRATGTRRPGSPGDAEARPPTLAEEAQRNVLLGLARQFGEAIGRRAALRSALGSPPDPEELRRRFEPHERGSILVAAVFDAFFSAYAGRMSELLRIVGDGAVTRGGELSLELSQRLAGEAAKTARHFLCMCIRALDYCPPVDITFGDYLRAMLTADFDLLPDDDLGYRQILIDAFRRRGLMPPDVTSHSESSLVWQPVETAGGRRLFCEGLSFDVIHGTSGQLLARNASLLSRFGKRHARALHLQPGTPVQAWNFHPVHRVSPDGELRFQVIVELLQRKSLQLQRGGPRLAYRGGTTLILDARSGEVLYGVHKRLDEPVRKRRQLEFWSEWEEDHSGAFRAGDGAAPEADFARLHRGA